MTDMQSTPLPYKSDTRQSWIIRVKQGIKESFSIYQMNALTQMGIRGGNNQDSILLRQNPIILAVADGVGGGAIGDVASKTATDRFGALVAPTPKILIDEVQNTDTAVKDEIAKYTDDSGGTTLVVALVKNIAAYIAHVGDSRAYLLRRRGEFRQHYICTQITEDHTFAALALRKGASLCELSSSTADAPWQVLGLGQVSEVGNNKVRLHENDILLLCTDGLHKFVTDKAISEIADEYLIHKKQSLETFCGALASQAVFNNSYDDISVSVLYRKPFLNVRCSFWLCLCLVVFFGLLTSLNIL